MHAEEAGFEGAWHQFPPMRNAAVAALIVAVAWGLERSGAPAWLASVAYLVAVLVGARFWAREGWEELREEREAGIDALMAAATLGAILLGQWLEGALLVVIYAAAEALEEFTYARTRHAIRSLLDLAPPTASRLQDGREEEVPAAALVPGDEIVVRPGERVPTDAVVVDGRSSLVEAAVTGESVPVDKGPGDRLFAGTVNTTGALTARVTVGFADNTLSRMIHLVEEAQEVKSRAQRWIDRFGRRYSPGVLATAILLLIVPPLFGAPFATWAYRAVVLLVAAAPCALVMSTPVATAAAITRAGRRGVLVKGGIHLEQLTRVRVVAFDKTGTLTRGRPQVTDLVPADGVTATELLGLAAAVERWSEHPLARAVVERAEAEGVPIPAAQAFEALVGAGARARLDGAVVRVGSAALLESEGLQGPPRLSAAVHELQAEGKTVVLVTQDSDVIGAVAFRDEPRSEAREAVDRLHALGLRVVMLTGDQAATALALGRALGVDEVHAGLRPEEKVAALRDLEARLGPVAMAGDGVNDAPAVAAATVGIAMGLAGSDAAVEAADVALMGDDPRGVVTALEVARRARRISLQNLAFSILILVVLVPSAVLGALGIAAAVVAHEVSELLAVANGLRAARA
ncbi:heavy metal translocating P-type ATPase [Limnochorda pilosa]|uniref:Cd(2+)-exporting ATPase n=1 Tax=Limnochorda pilosa TaxID=1555112 RepID=A0A0K2SQ30_LIMPI|nr:heavy metal translocating P-type ATPase [Limnochorda pilosa]BAS29196.1 ATPase [Limnochorda pilosa]